MGIALGLVWNRHEGRAYFPSYCFFYIQLGISFFWYIVLFRLHGMTTAMALITIQIICLALAVANFYRKSKSAGRLLLVSLAFIFFFCALNGYLLIANPPPHVGHWWTV
jgi:tryptophan-rich sensory protein